jgi:hypothetical protein
MKKKIFGISGQNRIKKKSRPSSENVIIPALNQEKYIVNY